MGLTRGDPGAPVAGVLLAAGASSRMGFVKAGARWRAKTFLEHGVAALVGGGCDPVLVVEGAHPLSELVPPGTHRVHAPDWSCGPLASLQAALRELARLGPDLAGVVVHTVDRPRVQSATVLALHEAVRAQARVWQPTQDGRRGHPVAWPRDAIPALLELDPRRSTPRELLRGSWASRRGAIPVEDPGVHDNIDSPQALAALPR